MSHGCLVELYQKEFGKSLKILSQSHSSWDRIFGKSNDSGARSLERNTEQIIPRFPEQFPQ